ncbi:MAG: hypothetical protein K2P80_04135 [Beijerinckiaceae bacterium]|nr:hypothetical protein [Beijerinckiaceae bacterium]
MVAAVASKLKSVEWTKTGEAKGDAFAQSRWIALCAGGTALPFLLAAPAAKPLHLLLVMAALLFPWATALTALRLKQSAVFAARLQVLVSALLAIGFLAAGLGPVCSLAFLALSLVDFEIAAPPRAVSLKASFAGLIGLAVLWLVAHRMALETGATNAYGAAALAFLPPFAGAVSSLRARRPHLIEPARHPVSEDEALVAATLRHGLETALLIDRSGRVLALGPNALDTLGAMATDLLGRGLFERLHLLDRPALLKACADIKPAAPSQSMRLRLRLDPPHPETRLMTFSDFDARIIPPADGGDRLVVFLSRSRVQEADRSRRTGDEVDVSERYLSEMSHHIRTPLNAVIGFSDLLASPATQPNEPGTIAEYGEIIHESGQTLLRITDALLDMVRLKSGSYVLAPQTVDPVAVIQSAETYLRDYFGEKRLTISITSVEIEGEWCADRSAAVATVAGVAAAMMDIGMTLCVALTVSSREETMCFAIAPVNGAALHPQSAAGLRERLSPRSGLLFEQAQALARYQGGAVSERLLPDGGFETMVTLPLALAEVVKANAPVDLESFRRGKDDEDRNHSEKVFKKHA